jgi:hypothetical protein
MCWDLVMNKYTLFFVRILYLFSILSSLYANDSNAFIVCNSICSAVIKKMQEMRSAMSTEVLTMTTSCQYPID